MNKWAILTISMFICLIVSASIFAYKRNKIDQQYKVQYDTATKNLNQKNYNIALKQFMELSEVNFLDSTEKKKMVSDIIVEMEVLARIKIQEKLLGKARKLRSAGQYRQAEKSILRLLEINPNNEFAKIELTQIKYEIWNTPERQRQSTIADKNAIMQQLGNSKSAYRRYTRLCSKYPNWSKDDTITIAQRKICTGMSEEQAREAWGSPEDINRSVGSWGVHEQWCYYSSYLYFENGILTSWQN